MDFKNKRSPNIGISKVALTPLLAPDICLLTQTSCIKADMPHTVEDECFHDFNRCTYQIIFLLLLGGKPPPVLLLICPPGKRTDMVGTICSDICHHTIMYYIKYIAYYRIHYSLNFPKYTGCFIFHVKRISSDIYHHAIYFAYCIRTLPRGGMYWVVHPQRPRDFRGPRSLSPNISQLEAVYGNSLIINPYLGIYQKLHPCRAFSIGSVKINTSLPVMRECGIQYISCHMY